MGDISRCPKNNSSQGERLDNELVTKLDALGPQKETQNQIKLRYMTR